MMNLPEIDAYLERLPYTAVFTDLIPEMREKVAFGAWEMLRRRFGAAVITNEMVALQAFYIAEGEAEEFAKFKRQNVNSISMEGMGMSFQPGSGANISPEVVALVEELTSGGDSVFFGELR